MQRLTKAEEEIMHIIWQLGRCTVSDVLDVIEKTDTERGRPPHSSISTIVRILEEKKFLDHKAYGKTYEYFPIVAKDDYSTKTLSKFITDYFEGSASNLVSALVKDEKLDADELKKLLDMLDK